MKRVLFAAALSYAACGCTTLKVNQAGPGFETRQGIAYFLPYTQFESAVTWSASCEKIDGKPDVELSLTPKFEATSKTGPDPNGLYVIDYRSLDALTKVTSVKVEFYDSGAIKSINASADDRTAEMVSKAISGAGKIAKVVMTAGNDVATCSSDLITNLGKIDTAKKDVETKTERLKQDTRRLDGITARVARAGSALSRSTKEELDAALRDVTAAQIELDTAKAVLTERLETATAISKTTFPETSLSTHSSEGIPIPLKSLRGWIAKKSGETDQQFENRIALIQKREAIWLELALQGDFAKLAAPTTATEPTPEAGIRYRVGLPGILRACKGSTCTPPPARPSGTVAAGAGLFTAGKEVKVLPVTILQKGSTFYLPFSSKPFTNAALSATFSQSGVLTSAGYDQKKAAGEAFVGLLDEAAGQAAGIIQARREARKTELQETEEQVKLAKAKNDLAAAEAAAEPAPNASVTSQTAALTAQTALKQAEIASINADTAKIEAQNKLAAAQAGTTP